MSMFFFSFGLSVLPPSVNSKMLLAVIGMGLAGYHALQNRAVKTDRAFLGAVAFAAVFSLICLFSVDFNQTSDYSYVSYIVSFFVWIFSAYTVCTLIRGLHGRVDIPLLTYYLAGVCLAQSLLALAIDSWPVFQFWVNRYIDQDQDFLQEMDRLYGIGASLDNAGVRFSLVLVMIAAVLSKEEDLRESRWRIVLLLTAFFTIIVVGNMISRTTSTGAGLALLYLIWNTGFFRLVLRRDFFRFHFIFTLMVGVALLVTTYFYRTDRIFHDHLRFAFEGFFNWIELGEWRTNSTDILSNMWVWPENMQGWLIGTGLFDNWVYGTDIGYCRFIMYCGLTGFAVFALFFIYNAWVFARRHPLYRGMFMILMLFSFIVWIKVSTDIFLVYALFYAMDMLSRQPLLQQEDEDYLLHRRNV